jgi:hypothetical protein
MNCFSELTIGFGTSKQFSENAWTDISGEGRYTIGEVLYGLPEKS